MTLYLVGSYILKIGLNFKLIACSLALAGLILVIGRNYIKKRVTNLLKDLQENAGKSI